MIACFLLHIHNPYRKIPLETILFQQIFIIPLDKQYYALYSIYIARYIVTHSIIQEEIMDSQLKRGLLEVCVLKALTSGDSYGYQIIKDLSENGVKISESTLYPILKRLESGNFLTVYSVEHSGRLRKYYSITEGGRKEIDRFLEEWDEVMKIYDFIRGGSENE